MGCATIILLDCGMFLIGWKCKDSFYRWKSKNIRCKCRYTFECSCADHRAMLLRLQQLGAAEQAFLNANPRFGAPGGTAAGEPPLPPQPWRNVQYNSHSVAPLLLRDLRRLAIPHEGRVTLDFVSHIVRNPMSGCKHRLRVFCAFSTRVVQMLTKKGDFMSW